MLQIIDDDVSENMEDKPELQDISLLLDFFIHELSCRNNFEFVQAVLKLFLKVYDLYIVQTGRKSLTVKFALRSMHFSQICRYMVKRYGVTQCFRVK